MPKINLLDSFTDEEVGDEIFGNFSYLKELEEKLLVKSFPADLLTYYGF